MFKVCSRITIRKSLSRPPGPRTSQKPGWIWNHKLCWNTWAPLHLWPSTRCQPCPPCHLPMPPWLLLSTNWRHKTLHDEGFFWVKRTLSFLRTEELLPYTTLLSRDWFFNWLLSSSWFLGHLLESMQATIRVSTLQTFLMPFQASWFQSILFAGCILDYFLIHALLEINDHNWHDQPRQHIFLI